MVDRVKLRSLFGGALLAASGLAGLMPAGAQAPAGYPTDLEHFVPLPKYAPKKTTWGDPDMRGIWPLDSLAALPLQRPRSQGMRVYLTPDEYAERKKRTDAISEAPAKETGNNKLGSGNWTEVSGAGNRTSLLISPADGRLPALTEAGKAADKAGRSSWVGGQTYDWVTDFDSWDRCISRGFPASMMPFRYNNGIQIFQAPGYVIINLEMIHDSRIIPIGTKTQPWPKPLVSWMGQSRGRWEGNTLVIETDHIRTGAAPINMAVISSPPNNTIPTSPQAKVVEKLTMTGPNSIAYELTYSDPVVWTAPWTIREDLTRNQNYGMFEYACHEGDVQVRNYISASRAARAKAIAVGEDPLAPGGRGGRGGGAGGAAGGRGGRGQGGE